VSGIGVGVAELLVILVVGLLYIPLIFYLLTLQKALSRCSPASRTLSPGLVWLLPIPFFGLVWHFVIVTSLAKSLHNEFTKRNINEAQNPGLGVGLAMCISVVIGIMSRHLGPPGIVADVLPGVFAIAALVCWVDYWLEIRGYSAGLQNAVNL
jgi:hypothetical protein